MPGWAWHRLTDGGGEARGAYARAPALARLRYGLTAMLLAHGASGCRCDDAPPPADAGVSAPAASATSPGATAGLGTVPRFDLVDHLGDCEIRHQGLSIDMGTPSVGPRRAFTLASPNDLDVVDRGGATFERVTDSRVRLDFWLDEAQPEGTAIAVRIHGGAARRVAGYVDEHRLGTVRLESDETTVVQFPPARQTLARGRHRLTLRFSGMGRASGEPYAEIDWVRIGLADEASGTYAAPTLRDVVEDFELAGRPRRSLVLRDRSSLRCPMVPAPGAELRVALGFWGSGRADVEVRVVQDGEPPVTMQQRKIHGGDQAKWIPLRIDLGAYAGQLIGLELRVLHTTPGGRVAFGDPAIELQQDPVEQVPEAEVAVLVVASGLDRRQIPPWGPIGDLAALGEVSRVATAFMRYRIPTTVPAGVFASLLSGLPPGAHTVEDPSARLPDAVRTVNRIVKEASGRTAFFTGVPTSFAAFGFGSNWDRFEEFSPVLDVPATEPLKQAARWLEGELERGQPARTLLVVHARGGHPPWDLSRDEVNALEPVEYGGVLDARRGGIVLGRIRGRRLRAHRRISADDWTRLRALQHAALLKQDAALGELIATLKHRGVWDQTLFIFCGDVASGDPPRLPFDPLGELREDRLLVPLVVKFPGPTLRVRESMAPATSVDVARTILGALRLQPPPTSEGEDLYRLALGHEPPAGRAQLATLGPHFAVRMGTWLLQGQFGRVPTLCRLEVDPACSTDVYEENPIAAQATWQAAERAAVSAREPPRRPGEREAASVDADTAAALTVWGDLE